MAAFPVLDRRCNWERVAKIRNVAIVDARTHTAGLILLFQRGKRPNRIAICDAVEKLPRISISYDPGLGANNTNNSWASDVEGGPAAEANSWLELLVDGLTFDMVGLAPGPLISAPEIEFRIDCPQAQDIADFELVGLAPGPHLAGGGHSLVVAKALAGLGCDLASALGTVEAFFWLPSRTATGAGFFRSTIASWMEGGPFPALGLTAFRSLSDGGIESVGLDFFTGQEVRIPSNLATDLAAATRLGMRLVNQLALNGPLNETEIIVGPDGVSLQLEPVENGQVVLARAT